MVSMLSLKVGVISTSVVFLGLAMKLCAPPVMEFSASRMPLMWASLLSWLKPPYLYVIINCIIISIAASSRFHHKSSRPDRPDDVSSRSEGPAEMPPEFPAMESAAAYEQREEPEVPVAEVEKSVVVNGFADEEEEEEVFEAPPLKRMDSSEIPYADLFTAEKPPVSARFGHRKQAKATTEGGKALRVAKPKRHETLENTWKAITEGRSMPLSRHMKKCETWENQGRGIIVEFPEMKKSETFKDRSAPTSAPVPTGLRREPSLSQDELNRRVEAFINKFNEEMRLQRQESLNQYKEMINRGSH